MAEDDIDQLFAQTLQGDYDDVQAWKAVRSLQSIGTKQVFDKAVQWTESGEPLVRARGLDVIGQLKNAPAQESYNLVLKSVQQERDVQPLSSALSALGHLRDLRAIPLLAAFQSHPSEQVRLAVACAMGSFPNDPLSIRTLLTLTEDDDLDVRDWATFTLGVLGDKDSPEIREALHNRLGDEYGKTSEKALVGLAKRHDTSMLDYLIVALEQEDIPYRVVEAACTLLGLKTGQVDWSGKDYVKALRRRFPDNDR